MREVAHYVTRNRTQELDSFPFFSLHDRSRTLFVVASRVRISQRERSVLGRGPVQFLVKPLDCCHLAGETTLPLLQAPSFLS